MNKIAQSTLQDKMPITQLSDSLRAIAAPVTERLSGARLHKVAHLILQGLVTAESPLVTQIARGTSHRMNQSGSLANASIASWRTNASVIARCGKV